MKASVKAAATEDSEDPVATKPKKGKKNKGKFELYKTDEGNVSIRGEESQVAPDELRANPFNYKSMSMFMFDKLKENFNKVGYLVPIIVRSGNQDGPFDEGGFEIIDGEHRWKAATELEMGKVRIIDLGNVADSAAKALMVTLNEIHGSTRRDDLQKLVAELKIDDPDLLMVLPFTEDEANSMAEAGAADLAALESLGEGDGMSEEEDDDEEGDDEDGVPDVGAALGVDELTPSEHKGYVRRLEEVASKLGVTEKNIKSNPAFLLDKMIATILDGDEPEEDESDDDAEEESDAEDDSGADDETDAEEPDEDEEEKKPVRKKVKKRK